MERGPLPLYYRLFQTLRGRIVSGEYSAGSQLPTETSLMAAFGVSRHTVRTATQHLAQEGLVDSFAGRGTFVAAPSTARSRWGLDSIEDLIASSAAHRYLILGARFVLVRGTSELAAIFGTPAGGQLYFVKALRSSEIGPYAYSRIHLPADIGEKLPPSLLPTRPLLLLAETEAGAVAVHARQTITCAPASGDAAKVLKLEAGTPVLAMRRTYFADDGRAIVHSLVQARSDRYEQVINVWRRGAETEVVRHSGKPADNLVQFDAATTRRRRATR